MNKSKNDVKKLFNEKKNIFGSQVSFHFKKIVY